MGVMAVGIGDATLSGKSRIFANKLGRDSSIWMCITGTVFNFRQTLIRIFQGAVGIARLPGIFTHETNCFFLIHLAQGAACRRLDFSWIFLKWVEKFM